MQKLILVPYTKIRSQRTIPLPRPFTLGSSLLGLSLTFILLNTLSALYLSTLSPSHHPLPFLLSLLFLLLSNTLLFLTVCTDPGVIPQQIRRYETDESLFNIPIAEEPNPPTRSYGIPQSHLYPEIKYCEECRIYRPVRTIHCGKCNHCVEVFDHHCVQIGVCIGKRNYKQWGCQCRYFMGFCVALLIHLLIVIVVIVYMMVGKVTRGEVLESLRETVTVIVVFIVSGFFFVSVGYLVWYQVRLLRRGVNMNEDLKGLYRRECGKPFESGVLCWKGRGRRMGKEEYYWRVWSELGVMGGGDGEGEGESVGGEASTERSNNVPLLEIGK